MASESPEQTSPVNDRDTAGRTWMMAAAALLLLTLAISGRTLAARAALNTGLLRVLRATAVDAQAQHNLAAAERNLQRALAWGLDSAQGAHVGLAILSEQRGDPTTAAKHWQSAGYTEANLLAAAQELFSARQYPAAAAWYERALIVRPADATSWEFLVISYARSERWQRALDAALRGAEQLGPATRGYSSLMTSVGTIRATQLAQPDPQGALHALNAALEADRFSSERSRVEALSTRADLLRRTGRGDEAIADYEQALAVEPQRYWPLCHLGSLYWSERGDADAAETALLAAVALRPNYNEAYYRLAALYRRTGRPGRAIEMYKQILALDPADTRAEKALQSLQDERKAS